MTTKSRILEMERHRLAGRRLRTTFHGMGNEEFCAMLGVPLDAPNKQLLALVQAGAIEDFAGTYRPRSA